MKEKPQIIAIVGPTATGKSDLGVLLGKHFGGEVISADSRQVYRGLDIGTGKIRRGEMKNVVHHLINVADPKRAYSVARFKRDAKKAIEDIVKQGKLPIVVGGTGFYIDALLTDMSFPDVLPDSKLRARLAKLSTRELYQALIKLDPDRAEIIDKNNPVRLIRAIEVASHAGPVSPLTTSSPYDVFYIGLGAENELLKERIGKRLGKRMHSGMLAEFKQLHAQGLSWKRMEALGLEYRYGARLLQGMITREEFNVELSREIFRYAKRQMTWFKRNKQIVWVDIKNTGDTIALAKEFLSRN